MLEYLEYLCILRLLNQIIFLTGPSARSIRKRVIKAGWGIDDFENLDDLTLREKYPNILNFYVEPPGCDIRLETMETLAMERLRFLRIIEKYGSLMKNEEWVQKVKDDINSNGLSDYINLQPRGLANRHSIYFRTVCKLFTRIIHPGLRLVPFH